MKTLFRIILLIMLISGLDAAQPLYADPPNPPVVPGSHGQGGNINGAPLDGTLGVLLLIAGAAYGGWMLMQKKKQQTEDQATL